ncbi:heparinase II/III domain-containing protein [Propionibacteriaceae bacterium Y2011]
MPDDQPARPAPQFPRRTFLASSAALSGAAAMTQLPQMAAHAVPEVLPPPVKTRSTLYTPEEVAAARENVGKFAWAQELRDAAVAKAAPLLAQTDDWLWSSITSQGLPRSYAVNQDLGSPITGTEYYKYGAYSWIGDPYGEPWKLKDPSSDYVFPTNDFAAFHASGLNERGEFDRSLADESLLVNELYPEKGPDWGVDDGFGWVDENGDKWTFVAYYNHWFVWGYNNYSATGKALVSADLQAARDAYLYTGDVRYAHAGLIMLDRIADVYPSLYTGEYRREDGYLASDGHRRVGKETGCIWATFVAQYHCSFYDAFFPAIADGDDAGVLEFLRAKAAAHGLPAKNTVADIRSNIEHGIIRQIYPDVQTSNILGNFGMHQSALAMAAVVLDHAPETQEWIDFVFAAGGLIGYPEGPWTVTGGNVYAQLINDVDRDGWGYESPGYNELWITQMKQIADVLEGYDGYPAADLYQNPKFAAMMVSRRSLTVQNTFTPAIGDSLQVGIPYLMGDAAEHGAAYQRYPTPEQAQMAYLVNDDSVTGLNAGVFAADPEAIQDDIQQVIDTRGPLNLASDNLTGYGAAFFRNGIDGPAALSYSGPTRAHGQRNSLYVDLWGYGLNLASSLGYPEFADGRALTTEWNHNTVAANTVVFDAKPQESLLHNESQPHQWAITPQVKLTETSAPTAYPDAEQYRRSFVQVMINDTDAYYVDLFRVDGGAEHVYSFHGVASTAAVDGVELTQQSGGSYAGPTINPPADNATADRTKNGYDWLTNVSRGTPSGPYSVDWGVLDPYDVLDPDLPIHLRLTMLNDVDEVALADGRAPRNKAGNPDPLRYLLAKRTGDDLSSRFCSIIQPYNGSPFIRAASQVAVEATEGTLEPGDAVAVKVELVDGRVDYLVFNARPEVQVKVDNTFLFRGAFAMFRHRDRAALHGVTVEGTQLVPLATPGSRVVQALSAASGAVTGTVADFSRELTDDNHVVLELSTSVADVAALVGNYVFVESDGVRNATYLITSAELSGTRLDLGVRGTTIRRWVDAEDQSLGYVYDVAVGRTARIPITREWSLRR